MRSGQTIFDFRGSIDATDWQCLNRGGFASVRSPPIEQDLSTRDSFVVRMHGDGHRFKFNVRSESGFDAPTYQCSFETLAGEWKECRLPFAAFVPAFRGGALTGMPALNAARIRSVGFLISGKQSGPFRLAIDWVKASGSS